MSEPTTRPASTPATDPAAKPVVLVADDYAENRRLVYFYLRKDYEVVQASSAEEALKLIEEGGIDFVVMDLNFKDGMNGVQAVKAIRQMEGRRDLPVIALTAYAYPDDRKRCLEAGFDDYLSKPVFKDVMLRKIEAVMNRQYLSGDGSDSDDMTVWISRKEDIR